MNEQAIVDSYNEFVKEGYTKSLSEFKTLLATNPNALQDSYNVFKGQGYSKSIDEYKVLMGVSSGGGEVKKKETTVDGGTPTAQKNVATESASAGTSSASPSTDQQQQGTMVQNILSKVQEQTPIFINGQGPLAPTQPIKKVITPAPASGTMVQNILAQTRPPATEYTVEDETPIDKEIKLKEIEKKNTVDKYYETDARARFAKYAKEVQKENLSLYSPEEVESMYQEWRKEDYPRTLSLSKNQTEIPQDFNIVKDVMKGLDFFGIKKESEDKKKLNVITTEVNGLDNDINNLQRIKSNFQAAQDIEKTIGKPIEKMTYKELAEAIRPKTDIEEGKYSDLNNFIETSGKAAQLLSDKFDYLQKVNADKIKKFNELNEAIDNEQDPDKKIELTAMRDAIKNDPSVVQMFAAYNRVPQLRKEAEDELLKNIPLKALKDQTEEDKNTLEKIIAVGGSTVDQTLGGFLTLPKRLAETIGSNEGLVYEYIDKPLDVIGQNLKNKAKLQFSQKGKDAMSSFVDVTDYDGGKLLVKDGKAYALVDNNYNELPDAQGLVSKWNSLPTDKKTKVSTEFNGAGTLWGTSQVVADMLPLIAGGEILAAEKGLAYGAGKLSTEALAKKYVAGTLMTIAQTHDSFYDQVKDNPNMTEQQKNAYAMAVATGISMLNMGFGGFEKRILGAAEEETMKKIVTKNIAKIATGEISPITIVSEFAKATLKNAGKEIPEELMEEIFLEPLLQNAITSITNKATGANIETQNIDLQSIKDQALPIILSTGVMGSLGSYKGKNRLQNDAIYSASQDFNKFKETTTQLVMDKQIQPSVAAATINTVEKVANTINSVPGLTEEQKYNVSSLMLDNDKVQVFLDKNISEVLKDKYKTRISENNAVIAKILGNEALTPEEVTANGLVEPPAAMEATKAMEPLTAEEMETKKSDVESRRQEELGVVNSVIAKSETTGEMPTVNGELVNKQTIEEINAKYDAELKALEEPQPAQEAKTVDQQIVDLRAEEQAEYAAMPDPNDEMAKKEIYDRYDKLLTPLLESQKKQTEPTTGNEIAAEQVAGFNEGVKAAADAAREYRETFFPKNKQMEEAHGPVRNLLSSVSKTIANAYQNIVHSPNSAKVKEAYDAMINETKQQYEFLVSKGLNIERHTGAGEPYANSKEMLADLKDNNTIKFLPNEVAFGAGTTAPSDNIGLQPSGIKLKDGYEMTNSELFRVVHDYFGHGILGNQFGAIGEENATLQHLHLYSDKAAPAVIFQTRGQNSWVNFSGANEQSNELRKQGRALAKEGKTEEAKKLFEQADKLFKFAEPKIGLLPNKLNFKRYETTRRLENEEAINNRADTRDNDVSKSLEVNSNRSRRTRGVNKRDVRKTQRLRGVDVNIVAEYSFDNKILNGIKKIFPNFKGTQKIYEITNGDAYRKLMVEALENNPFAASVTVHSPEEFDGMRMFVTEDGSTGITLTKEGFLGGAFSLPERPNNLAQLIVLGIKEGAITAECFDTILPNYYTKFGFKAVSRIPFNDELKPMVANGYAVKDWDYKTYENFNDGRPDLVFFVYDGGDRNTIEDRIDKFDLYSTYEKENTKEFGKDEYDKAQALMNQMAIKTTEHYEEQESGKATKENVKSEADMLEAMFPEEEAPDGEARFRLAEEGGEPTEMDIEDIVAQMNDMPQAEIDFTEPEVSQKGLKVNPVQESNSVIKIAKKISDALLKPIQYFNGIPMIMGMSDMLAAGKIKNSAGKNMDVEGGLLFNVLGKNKNAAWAGVTEEGANKQYNDALNLYKNNKELFDRLWKEGRLPDGHIPMAILRMSDTAINSNEAVFRWILPTVESFSAKNKKNAMTSFMESMNEKLNTESSSKAQKIIDFVKEKKITSLDQFFRQIISDSNLRAKGSNKAKLNLDDRSLIYDSIFAPSGIKTASKPTIKSLLEGTDNSKNNLFTSDVIYKAIGEPSMLKTKQGEVVSVVGIDVKNGGVVPVKHGNYGFGPKGKTIALIENPKHGIDVFAEWKAKASRIFKKNKKGEFPTAKNVATQTGGAFFTDKAFISAKVSEGAISDLNLLIGKLRFAFPSVSVSTTQEEFDNIINSPDVRKSVSNGKIILGLTKDGKIYLNPSIESLKTPIHEFGHIWIDFLRSEASGKKGTELLNQGLKLVKNTEAHKKAIKKYGNNDIALEEALVELMANKGSTIIDAATKSNFKSWMNAVFKYIQSKFTTFKDLDASRISEMKLDEFINTGLADLFSGSEVSSKFKPNLSEAATKARMSIGSKIDNIVSQARAQGFSEDGIKEFLRRKGLTDEDIATAMGKVGKAATRTELSEETLTGYDKIMSVVQKGLAKGMSIDNMIATIQATKIYVNATDVQREMLIRDVRGMYGMKEKSAPSVTKLFPELKNANAITMTEKDLLKKQFKDLARGAKDAKAAWTQASLELAKYVKELKDSGKITVNQVANVISKFSKVNMFNENSVNNFVDYMANVFADAEYNNKISLAASKLKTVRNNIGTKLGIAKELVPKLNRLFSINPKLVPMEMLDEYLSLVEMLGERTAVLTLDEKNDVISRTDEILDAINNEQEQVEILSEKFNLVDKVLDKDNNVLYADTIDKMVKDDVITEKEAEIMRKYKSEIYPVDKQLSPDAAKIKVDALVREGADMSEAIRDLAAEYGMTEDEVNGLLDRYKKENNDLINLVISMPVNSSDLPSRDERKLAKRLKELASSNALKGLTNQELRNLLKVMDNINNGYISHYAQVMVEKMNAFDRSTVVEKAIKRAALLPASKLYAMAKKVIFKDSTALTMIKRNPLYYVDQVFGDFKTKDVFDSVFKAGAQALSALHTDLKIVDNMLDRAMIKVSKSHGNNPNKITNSLYKMGVYLRQLEYESNKGSKQVNPASAYIKATVKHINSGESQYGEKDAEMLNEIMTDYSDSDGQIDLKELYDSFNPAEKAAIKTIQDVNESMVDKAMYTASIINGKKINPLANYSHVMVLATSLAPNATDLATAADNAMNLLPSTKAKSLEEREKNAKAINFDPFASTHRSAKMVLTDYHLTEPVRTARRTLSDTKTRLEDSGNMTTKDRDISNALKAIYDDTIKHILSTSYQESTGLDDAFKFVTTQAYRTVLAGTGRFVSELASNIGFAVPIIANNPSIMKAASKFSSVIMGINGASIMNNLKSMQTSRVFPSDALSSSAVDTSTLSKTHGKIGGKAIGDVNNKVQQIYNNTLKKYKNSVEFIADTLVSTPDKAIIRPIWFGTFASEFKKITGEDPDFEKIASNDEQYMSEHDDHLAEATNKADQMSVFTGATENAFMDIAKGKSLPNQGNMIKAFNTINGFMQKFMIYEYITARTAVAAAAGRGMISKKEGAAMLGGVVTRIIMYSMLSKMMANLIAKAFGGGDDEEDDDKTFLQKLGQGGASAMSSLVLGRDFGAITKTFINFLVEKGNEKYLDFLRNGDYDPFKDNIERSAIPTDLTKDSGFDNFLINMSGPLSPLLKTTKLVWKNVYGPEKKEQAAIDRQQNEKMYRIPLEILGNAGFIPIYKDVRNVVNSAMYKNMKTSSAKLETSDKNFKATLKKTDPVTYNSMYGEMDKIKSDEEKLTKEMRDEIKRIEKEMKY